MTVVLILVLMQQINVLYLQTRFGIGISVGNSCVHPSRIVVRNPLKIILAAPMSISGTFCFVLPLDFSNATTIHLLFEFLLSRSKAKLLTNTKTFTIASVEVSVL